MLLLLTHKTRPCQTGLVQLVNTFIEDTAVTGPTSPISPVMGSKGMRSSAMRPSGLGTSSISVCSGISRRGMS